MRLVLLYRRLASSIMLLNMALGFHNLCLRWQWQWQWQWQSNYVAIWDSLSSAFCVCFSAGAQVYGISAPGILRVAKFSPGKSFPPPVMYPPPLALTRACPSTETPCFRTFGPFFEPSFLRF